MAKIRVVSADYDVCLARKNFNGDIVEDNRLLVDALLSTKNNYKKTIGLIGSNRQSSRDNKRNTTQNNNGSCFDQTPKFYAAIDAEFNPFLLADLYNNAPHGTSFKEATSSVNNEFKHKGWLHDKSKISIIYAQIQKIANEYPDDEIDFEFYDDKDEILNGLYLFFNRNKKLIPKQCTLNLHRFAGKEIANYPPIIGEGEFINKNYAQTLIEFAKTVLKSFAVYDVDGNEIPSNEIQSTIIEKDLFNSI